jgi:hypothetical protein
MESDSFNAANTKRREPVLVLQATKLALDRCAATVEVAEALGVPRDERLSACSSLESRSCGGVRRVAMFKAMDRADAEKRWCGLGGACHEACR